MTLTWKQLWGHMLNISSKINFLYSLLNILKALYLLPPAVMVEDWTRLSLHNELKDASALQSKGKMCGPRKVTCRIISV